MSDATVPLTAAERERVVDGLAQLLHQGRDYTWQIQAERVLTYLRHPARMDSDS